VGDGGVTAKMPSWYPSSVAARTTVTPPSDRRSVVRSARPARTRRRTASRGAPVSGDARTHGEGAPRAEGLGRRVGRGRRGLSAHRRGTRRAAGSTSRRGCLAPVFVLLVPCLKSNYSKFLNKSRLNCEYKSGRSSHPLQLLERL
jgi:hypothetical protein